MSSKGGIHVKGSLNCTSQAS